MRVALHTPVSRGGLVTTAVPGAGAQHIDDQFLRTELQDIGPAELLARHREHVEQFVKERGLEAESDTLAGLAVRCEEHDRRQHRTGPPYGALAFFGVCFGVPSLIGLLAWQYLGPDLDPVHWVPLSLCFGTAVYAAVTNALIPYLIRQELQRQNPPTGDGDGRPCRTGCRRR
jgi:hypothetical protein